MRAKTMTGICGALIAMAIGASSVWAAKQPAVQEVELSAAGQKLLARYSDQLKALQAEIEKALPKVDEEKMAAFLKAREEVTPAETAAEAARKAFDKINTGKALVDHAKGKWIGGAEKGIAAAQASLKKATTEAEREAAQQELVKWQKNKEDGLQALKERQKALDEAKVDEPKLIEADRVAKEALAKSQTNALMAARAILQDLDTFLASDKLDAKLVKCTVLAQATPRSLAEFAQQGKEQEALVEKLLRDDGLMKQMLEAGGAAAKRERRGYGPARYGQAMKIYTDIRSASKRSKDGILHRLALGTSLVHAVPICHKHATTVVDPVKRYLHFEKAYLDGELDPAFEDMSAWECRYIADCDAPDSVMAWGREMLRNFRPDHISPLDYGRRYSGVVSTDVRYGSQDNQYDKPELHFYQNILMNGGICGRLAFFGRFIVESFGIPALGVGQHAHAALGRWTPTGWVVNLGAGWEWSWSDGRSGLDFLLETQAR